MYTYFTVGILLFAGGKIVCVLYDTGTEVCACMGNRVSTEAYDQQLLHRDPATRYRTYIRTWKYDNNQKQRGSCACCASVRLACCMIVCVSTCACVSTGIIRLLNVVTTYAVHVKISFIVHDT